MLYFLRCPTTGLPLMSTNSWHRPAGSRVCGSMRKPKDNRGRLVSACAVHCTYIELYRTCSEVDSTLGPDLHCRLGWCRKEQYTFCQALVTTAWTGWRWRDSAYSREAQDQMKALWPISSSNHFLDAFRYFQGSLENTQDCDNQEVMQASTKMSNIRLSR